MLYFGSTQKKSTAIGFLKPVLVNGIFHTSGKFLLSEKAAEIFSLMSNFAEAKRQTAGLLTKKTLKAEHKSLISQQERL